MPSPPAQHDIARSTLGGAALAGLLYVALRLDTEWLRAYWSVDWPAWTSAAEDAASAWGYRAALGAGFGWLILVARGSIGWHALLALPAEFLLTEALKWACGRVRPMHGGDGLLFMPFHGAHDAFPSGHAAGTWTLALLLMRRYPRWAAAWLLPPLPFCWARVHASAHFVGDLIGGFAVAWAAVSVTEAMFGEWIRRAGTGDPIAPRSVVPRGTVRAARAIAPLAVAIVPVVAAIALHRAPVPSGAFDEAAARETVTRIYQRFLGREPDPAGEGYVREIRDGRPAVAVVRSVLLSEESRSRLVRQTAPAERADHVRALLGLDPEDAISRVSGRLKRFLENPATARHGLYVLTMRWTISEAYTRCTGAFRPPGSNAGG